MQTINILSSFSACCAGGAWLYGYRAHRGTAGSQEEFFISGLSGGDIAGDALAKRDSRVNNGI